MASILDRYFHKVIDTSIGPRKRPTANLGLFKKEPLLIRLTVEAIGTHARCGLNGLGQRCESQAKADARNRRFGFGLARPPAF
jgi:hypothetical protein